MGRIYEGGGNRRRSEHHLRAIDELGAGYAQTERRVRGQRRWAEKIDNRNRVQQSCLTGCTLARVGNAGSFNLNIILRWSWSRSRVISQTVNSSNRWVATGLPIH